MKKALLKRFSTSNHGTFGFLSIEGSLFHCFMLELPWRNNERQRSCIPSGLYQLKWHRSPRFGMVYKVEGVEGRSEILFHTGNFAGDVSLGYKSNSHGCLLPCTKIGKMEGQQAGLISRPALNSLVSTLNKEPALLEIINDFSNPSNTR